MLQEISAKAMAKIENNPILGHLKGRINDLVFRRYGNTTVVYEYRKAKGKYKPTVRQAQNQNTFRKATGYAKKAMRDPVLKMEYQLKARSLGKGNAYNAAMQDFLNKPRIIDADLFNNVLIIKATDDFKVDLVEAQILSGNNVIEQGNALLLPDGLWRYEIKKSFSDKECEVIITAFDVPGNFDRKVMKMPGGTL